jgi:hypothetical protein
MPFVHIYCQLPDCQRDDDNVEYWQCVGCRLVMCRDHWQNYTFSQHPVGQNAGFFAALGQVVSGSVVWDCPVCDMVTEQHKIFPVAMPRLRPPPKP